MQQMRKTLTSSEVKRVTESWASHDRTDVLDLQTCLHTVAVNVKAKGSFHVEFSSSGLSAVYRYKQPCTHQLDSTISKKKKKTE